MERKIISIDIKPDASSQETSENAGVMWEHNATEIKFNLDETYVGEDYRYYIEYRSVMGTKDRTAYLTEFNKQIKFVIPVTMTSLKSVECYFNIVTIDGDGNTIQVIKPVKFCLDFDFSGDVDNSVARSNDFSINLLLEAIRNNTFKGEKGDKGDSYELTQEDLLEISRNVNEDIYGLPFVREMKGNGTKKLKNILTNGLAESFEVACEPQDFEGVGENSPVYLDCAIDVNVCIGKNEAEHLLKPEKYTEFYKDASIYDTTYFVAPLFLKPNTEYVLVRGLKQINQIIAGIKAKEGECQFFVSYSEADCQKGRVDFATGESGVAFLVATDIGDDIEVYREVLQGSFYGLGIYEKDKFYQYITCFDKPLYSVSENCCDIADLVLGTATYNVAHLQVPTSVAEVNTAAFNYDGRIIYRYELPLTEAPDCRLEYDVFSTHYKSTDVFINSAEDAGEFLEQNVGGVGIYFDRVNSKIYIYSNRSPNTYKVFLQMQEAKDLPVMIYYQRRNPITESIEKNGVFMGKKYDTISVYPSSVNWRARVSGNISDALNEMLDTFEAL